MTDQLGAVDDATVELVARALCAASGESADRLYDTGEMEAVVEHTPMTSHAVMKPVTAPGWRKYEREARRFIAAQAALKRAGF